MSHFTPPSLCRPGRPHHSPPGLSPLQMIFVILECNPRKSNRQTDGHNLQVRHRFSRKLITKIQQLSVNKTFDPSPCRLIYIYHSFSSPKNWGTNERRSFSARVCCSWHRYPSISVWWSNVWPLISVLTGLQLSNL